GGTGGGRYGVAYTGPGDLGEAMNMMGVKWYLDYTPNVQSIPPGCSKAIKVPSNVLMDTEELRRIALARPGSYWIIGNEPNVPGQDDLSPDSYAENFHYYQSVIKSADPTAQIVAPEVLNFSYTCTGCGGFTQGRSWVEGFRKGYLERYGVEPPVDVWSIHTYDLNWEKLPMVDHQVQIQQIGGFREYLEAMPGHKGKPIWLTEFAVVWGYEGAQWLQESTQLPGASGIAQEGQELTLRAHPWGEMRRDLMAEYLKRMLEWLDMNSEPLNIQRWFIFSSHGYRDPWAAAPGGIALLESAGAQVRRTDFGSIYREWAMKGTRP
ncbi:MAG: hypothetical protein HW403_1181, partial [Dehalococcoidia bacterium]|nr:hypothetical protein [Dehalococcoidia bacterium]